MLDAIGTILIFTLAAAILVAIISTLTTRLGQRLLIGAASGLGIGIAVVVTATGALAKGPQVLGILFSVPLIVAAILWSRSQSHSAMISLPMPLLIGINVARVLGFMFLLLAADGRLGGPFPISAGWGDIITGVVALPLALAVSRGTASNVAIAAWNTFGTLDLVAAVTLGAVSANGSPIQLIHAGAGSAAMTTLPWSLIPTILVPFFLVVHGIVFAQLRARAPRRVSTVAMPA